MYQVLPAPTTPRQLLSLFLLFDREKGLPSMLNHVDLTGVSRRHLFGVVLGRMPENPTVAADGDAFVPRQALGNMLNGAEFQTKIRELVLNAFPEKRRIVFVHIPKCAGSDLIALLRRRHPMVHVHLAMPGITQKPELFGAIRDIVAGAQFSDSILATGHTPLRWYRERNLIRPEDDLFTVVRDPRGMIYSYISFILTRLKTFAGTKRNDTTGWLRAIDMEEIAPDPSNAYLAELGSRLLRARNVTTPNMICNNLGKGDADSARDAIVHTNIEITDTRRYSEWKRTRFNVDSDRRINESLPLFTPDIATSADRALIDDMAEEDMKLYEPLAAALAASPTPSLRGAALG